MYFLGGGVCKLVVADSGSSKSNYLAAQSRAGRWPRLSMFFLFRRSC